MTKEVCWQCKQEEKEGDGCHTCVDLVYQNEKEQVVISEELVCQDCLSQSTRCTECEALIIDDNLTIGVPINGTVFWVCPFCAKGMIEELQREISGLKFSEKE